jgi:hypothetical protein
LLTRGGFANGEAGRSTREEEEMMAPAKKKEAMPRCGLGGKTGNLTKTEC